MFFNPRLNPTFNEELDPAGLLEHRRKNQPLELARVDALGKPDVVPSAAEYMLDLRNMQITFYAEIIRGDRPLEDFDLFVSEWRRRGGDILTREANDLHQLRDRIYQRVGVAQ